MENVTHSLPPRRPIATSPTSTPGTSPPAERRNHGLRENSLGVPSIFFYIIAAASPLTVVVALYPIIYAVWLSLHQYSLIQAGLTRWAEPNAPFGNYTEALWGSDSSQFWTATRITFVFTIVSVFFELILELDSLVSAFLEFLDLAFGFFGRLEQFLIVGLQLG